MEEDLAAAGRRRRQIPRIPETPVLINDESMSQSILRKPGKIIWDNQNVGIPTNLSIEDFLRNLKRNMKRYGFTLNKVEIFNVSFPEKMWSDTIPESKVGLLANNAGLEVTLHWVDTTLDRRREDVDIEVMFQLLEYSLQRDPPYALLLVAADKDYINLIERLRTRNGVEVYMSSRKESAKTVSSKNYFIDWRFLISKPKPEDYSPQALQYITPAQRSNTRLENDPSIMVIMDAQTSPPIPRLSKPDALHNRIESLVSPFGLEIHSVEGIFQFDDSEDSEKLELTKLAMELYYYGDGIGLHPLKYPVLKGNKKKRTPDMAYVDVKIIEMMYHWGISTMAPAPMLVITCDPRIARAVKTLTDTGFQVYVATNLEIPILREVFEGSGATVIGWP